MIVLDTNYVSLFQYPDSQAAVALHERLVSSTDPEIVTTAVTPREQMRGWLSAIHRQSDVQRQVPYYDRLVGLFRFFADWRILPAALNNQPAHAGRSPRLG
ncbi:MAG: hypothetical protein JSS02_06915 [Planctomycetes bacterium]|nr:hypothetical protein [Planctomycetota bacterium]